MQRVRRASSAFEFCSSAGIVRAMRFPRASAAALAAGLIVLGLHPDAAVRQRADDDIEAPPSSPFEVADTQSYKIRLDTQRAGRPRRRPDEWRRGRPHPPNGKIVRDRRRGRQRAVDVAHRPATLEFADATIEVCDGLPEYVEDGTLTSDWYCPRQAVPTALTLTLGGLGPLASPHASARRRRPAERVPQPVRTERRTRGLPRRQLARAAARRIRRTARSFHPRRSGPGDSSAAGTRAGSTCRSPSATRSAPTRWVPPRGR